MYRFCVLLTLVSLSVSAYAAELVASVGAADALTGERVNDTTLRVTPDADTTYQALFEVAQPRISSPVYALRGRVRYDSIEGEAYLQLDSTFEGRGTFFSKAIADSGPLAKLHGSSEWREFVLPFHASNGESPEDLVPEKLVLGLFHSGSGDVFLKDLGIYQYAAGEDPLQNESAWFSGAAMGLAGGIGGALVGIWGALIGVLAGRGKARTLTMTSASILILFGVASLVAGITAVATGQPYYVFYPLILTGALLVFLIGGLRWRLPAIYAAHELKKMQAMDA